ncbi:hypothetical protein [Spiroplasma endosymbiont of Nebria brevicollis]|uniref:hypothetical protein n=1 Tax=Spiroplasma endosymbiont of Nebria brevicollis TaxID=3066284 RepID=UPI00313DC3C3
MLFVNYSIIDKMVKHVKYHSFDYVPDSWGFTDSSHFNYLICLVTEVFMMYISYLCWITLLLNKHTEAVKTLLRNLTTKKLLRIDKLTTKNIYMLSSLGNSKLGQSNNYIKINYSELTHQDLLIKWISFFSSFYVW